jgi:hypothetical protein
VAEHFPPVDDDQNDIPSPRDEGETPQIDAMRTVFASVAALIVLGFGAFAISWLMYTTSPSSRDTSVASTSHDPSDAPYVERPSVDATVTMRKHPISQATELRENEILAIRSSSNKRVVLRRDKLSESLSLLALEHESWNTYSPEVVSGEIGRRIASDETLIERFAAMIDRGTSTELELESFRDRFLSLSKVVDAISRDPSYEPSGELDEAIGVLSEEVNRALESVALRRNEINAIARLASSLTPSDQPLSEAIEYVRQRQLDERYEAIAEAKRVAEAKAISEIAAKKMEQARLKREIELAEIDKRNAALAKTIAEEKQKAIADEEERKRQARLAALEAEFNRDLGQINSMLKPFTSKGRTQPGSRGWRSDATYGPVSLSKLKSAGLLEDTVASRQNLYFLTTGNRYNDREHGAFPRYVGGASDWQRKHPTIERAQDLLQKYGDLMVQKGMLAP